MQSRKESRGAGGREMGAGLAPFSVSAGFYFYFYIFSLFDRDVGWVVAGASDDDLYVEP